jgi:pimeloyl-ACP methyl ester carboxylesterase
MRVLLLHALPLDERMWEPQVAALDEHEVVTPNLYSLAGQSMDMWAIDLLREVWGEVVVVGASMGGYAALALARYAPERVRALVLAGSRADADSEERKADRMETIERIQQGGAAALWEKMEPLLTAGASEDVVRRIHGLALGQQAEDLVRAVRAIRDRPDSTSVVAELDAPVLVLTGELDGLIPPDEARALAATARNGRAVILEGVGHLPSLQQPDRFNAELLGLLDELE